MRRNVSVNEIDALLPQTQCGECDYPGCRPYAKAIADGEADIDRCPPGGVITLEALAKLVDEDPAPYREDVLAKTRPPALALIREDECIGCTKCIQACPVDAIIGSAKQMHTVIASECTGCGLCVEPCPVDCIDLETLDAPHFDANTARKRFEFRNFRLQRMQHEKAERHRKARQLTDSQNADRDAKKAYIKAALARVKTKQNGDADE